MIRKSITIACLVAVVLAGIPLSSTAQDQPDLGKMFQAMMGGAQQGGSGEAVEPVNFRDLKAALPKELPGMKRIEASGERSAAMGMNISTAEGTYRGENNGRITIEISDIGGTGFAAMAHAGWANTEIDRETEYGYERTLKIEGYPAREEYDSKSENGEVSVWIEKRLMVKVRGQNVSDEVLKKAGESVDIKKLAELAKQAPAATEEKE